MAGDRPKLPGGWVKPVGSYVRHYFNAGFSLCSGWMDFGAGFDKVADGDPGNCKTCMRKLLRAYHHGGFTRPGSNKERRKLGLLKRINKVIGK